MKPIGKVTIKIVVQMPSGKKTKNNRVKKNYNEITVMMPHYGFNADKHLIAEAGS
jgi:hypothetical protein